MKTALPALAMALAATSLPVRALEFPVGTPQQRHGMEIAAVYLQPVEMAPAGMMAATSASDVHLEVDVRALAGNPNGFAEGDWIPYLVIAYEIRKKGSDRVLTGGFMPMVASDGPHYGNNVKLMGPGKYAVRYRIAPPSADPHGGFGRHTDRETGVRPWFEPFAVDYEFTYAGTGKKGGY